MLAARRRIAAVSGRLEDLVPLGAALADLERFDEADVVYREAFYSHEGVSPFPPAWVCFQLGMLWGELVPDPDLNLAALWYRQAIAYLPRYVKACVHLAEICTAQGQASAAEALLLPALSSRDPEVGWRLADVFFAQERFDEAEMYLAAAQHGFEELLKTYPLAFADHAAEFYGGSGGNFHRALELAQVNLANRPTRRAINQVRALAGASHKGANVLRYVQRDTLAVVFVPKEKFPCAMSPSFPTAAPGLPRPFAARSTRRMALRWRLTCFAKR